MIQKKWDNVPLDLKFSQTITEVLAAEVPSIDSRTLRVIYEAVAELVSNIIHHAGLIGDRSTCDFRMFGTKGQELTIQIIDQGISIPQSMLNKLAGSPSSTLNRTARGDSLLIDIAISGDQRFPLGRGTGLKNLASYVESQIFSSFKIHSRYGSISMKHGCSPSLGDADDMRVGTAVEFSLKLENVNLQIKTDITISVAEDFSRYPAGRYLGDGPNSGEAFKRDILEPALKEHNIVTLTLDGACGYPSSFLEESFGGLVRDGFDAAELEGRLNLISDDNLHLKHEIWKYIRRAEK